MKAYPSVDIRCYLYIHIRRIKTVIQLIQFILRMINNEELSMLLIQLALKVNLIFGVITISVFPTCQSDRMREVNVTPKTAEKWHGVSILFKNLEVRKRTTRRQNTSNRTTQQYSEFHPPFKQYNLNVLLTQVLVKVVNSECKSICTFFMTSRR